VADEDHRLLTEDAYEGYAEFCRSRSWIVQSYQVVMTQLKTSVSDVWGLTQRHDLGPGRNARGWQGLRLKTPLRNGKAGAGEIRRAYEFLDAA